MKQLFFAEGYRVGDKLFFELFNQTDGAEAIWQRGVLTDHQIQWAARNEGIYKELFACKWTKALSPELPQPSFEGP